MRRCGLELWKVFERYHYLTTTLHKAARCFAAVVDGSPVAFLAVLHQPHFQRNVKRVSRLVVLPDWQGVGIGGALLDAVAEIYDREGYVFDISTSAKNLIGRLSKSPKWKCKMYDAFRCDSLKSKISNNRRTNTTVRSRRVAVFSYRGEARPILAAGGRMAAKMNHKVTRRLLSAKYGRKG